MSLNAYVWASSLPLDLVGPTAFRVLLKYADRADQHGRTAWYTAQGLADELGCSLRTAQRAIRELLDSGLLLEGDQRYVKHLRGGYRPTVYDLNMRHSIEPRLPLGDTSHSVATELSRYDNDRSGDTSTAVAHRTVIEPLNKSLSNQGLGSYDKSDVARPAWKPPAPAPKLPRFTPDPPRPQHVDDAQQAINARAEELPCPDGFGTGKNSRHWCPPTGDGCVRCGLDSQAILEADQEIVSE